MLVLYSVSAAAAAVVRRHDWRAESWSFSGYAASLHTIREFTRQVLPDIMSTFVLATILAVWHQQLLFPIALLELHWGCAAVVLRHVKLLSRHYGHIESVQSTCTLKLGVLTNPIQGFSVAWGTTLSDPLQYHMCVTCMSRNCSSVHCPVSPLLPQCNGNQSGKRPSASLHLQGASESVVLLTG
jgi:hypothetical protein